MQIDILDPNPFANSTLALSGNATAAEIYTSVGFALDRWEHCEVSFGVLYSALIDPEASNYRLMRAFGSVAASNAKREMTFEACDAFFDYHANPELKAGTRKLLNLHKDASARRNEIAHAMVMGECRHIIAENRAEPIPTLWFLVPPIFASRKNLPFAGGPRYRYSTIEIGHLTSCFEELSRRASLITQEIRKFHSEVSNG